MRKERINFFEGGVRTVGSFLIREVRACSRGVADTMSKWHTEPLCRQRQCSWDCSRTSWGTLSTVLLCRQKQRAALSSMEIWTWRNEQVGLPGKCCIWEEPDRRSVWETAPLLLAFHAPSASVCLTKTLSGVGQISWPLVDILTNENRSREKPAKLLRERERPGKG